MPRFYTPEYARIKIRAAVRGMTFAQLAAKCGISRQALEMSLKGGQPNLAGCMRLVGVLDTKGHPMTFERLFVPVTTAELIAAAMWYAGLTGSQR